MDSKINDIFARLKQREIGFIGEHEAEHAAVALPIIQRGDQPSLLFQVRSYQLRSQPGEISFPGGKVEPEDLTTVETAARELSEETGIPRVKAAHIAPLDKWMTPYGIVIHPHIFNIDETEFMPNEEVEELFTVPIISLREQDPRTYMIPIQADPPKDFPFDKIPGGRNYRFRKSQMPERFYEYDGKIIWGLTARILDHFLTITNPNKIEEG